jgi:hypothetical protein
MFEILERISRSTSLPRRRYDALLITAAASGRGYNEPVVPIHRTHS